MVALTFHAVFFRFSALCPDMNYDGYAYVGQVLSRPILET